jgi:hypothetical protein
MEHRAMRGGKVGQELGLIELDIRDQRRAGLSYNETRRVLFDMVQVGGCSELGPEGNVEKGLDTQRGEIAVETQDVPREGGGHGRSHNRDHPPPASELGAKLIPIVKGGASAMRAGVEASAAADAEAMVYFDGGPRAVDTKLDRAGPDAGLAVAAFRIVDLDDGNQFVHFIHLLHIQELYVIGDSVNKS